MAVRASKWGRKGTVREGRSKDSDAEGGSFQTRGAQL